MSDHRVRLDQGHAFIRFLNFFQNIAKKRLRPPYCQSAASCTCRTAVHLYMVQLLRPVSLVVVKPSKKTKMADSKKKGKLEDKIKKRTKNSQLEKTSLARTSSLAPSVLFDELGKFSPVTG